MISKFWTKRQSAEIAELEQKGIIPYEVSNEINRVAEIMDKYYRSNREPETDDGGIIYLIFPTGNKACKETYRILLDRYHVKEDEIEFHDMLCQDTSTEWFADLYVVYSEFALTIIYPLGKGA